ERLPQERAQPCLCVRCAVDRESEDERQSTRSRLCRTRAGWGAVRRGRLEPGIRAADAERVVSERDHGDGCFEGARSMWRCHDPVDLKLMAGFEAFNSTQSLGKRRSIFDDRTGAPEFAPHMVVAVDDQRETRRVRPKKAYGITAREPGVE